MPLTEDKISLFASCIPVKGAKKSIICDVFRMRYHPIPNALFYKTEDILL